MAASLYIAYNAITSALSSPMTGTATSSTSGTVKTILQIKPGAKIQVVEWGYSFTSAPASPVQMELIETGTVFATVTSGGILNYNTPTLTTSAATTGTAATGYNASAEGTITATRLLAQNFDMSTFFKQQFPLDREPEVLSGSSLRVRATPTTSAASTVLCYVVWAE
jgi:hypothetical protein